MFGIITAWPAISSATTGLARSRSSQHRLMIHGSEESLVRRPSVFTVDDLMCMPPVSRTISSNAAPTPGWNGGNVAAPTVQYTHGMLSCSEFTGVRPIDVLNHCGADTRRGRYVLAEGGEGSD